MKPNRSVCHASSPSRISNRLPSIVFAAALVIATSGSLWGQQTTQDHPDAPSAARTADANRKAPAGTVNQRSLFFPNIATTEGPLTAGDKFKLFAADSASLSTLVGSALGAGIGQATNLPRGYGQGGEGYAKRFGASMARSASSNFFRDFVLASILHEDPRFFPQTDPTLGGSVKYSLTRVVVTRNDSGRDVTNWSGLLGPLMAEGLANSYWPDQDRTVGNTFQRYGIDLAVRAGSNMFRNYWPVIFKKMRGSSH